MELITGFNNDQYLQEQTNFILERAKQFNNKLYLEFGGKLTFDYHAARVLPGYDPNVKMRLLQRLKENIEIIICIHAGDIEKRKMRADFGISYDADSLKLIDDLREWDLDVLAVVITRFSDQPAVNQFKDKLERRQIKVYTHKAIHGYPTDLNEIVSENGYGANEYILTSKPIVVITAPGPGSGKMATCLSQVYHENRRGVGAGYAKFETFPIWNLPLKHPINVAYEAATADLGDINMVDPYHLEAYGKTSVNYNRDVEIFPVVKRILEKIMGDKEVYKSPTDMGVNRVGFAINNDAVCRIASQQEVIRRYFRYQCEYIMGFTERKTVERIKEIMASMNLDERQRRVVEPARQAARAAEEKGKGNANVFVGAALELKDGTLITGKNSPLLHAASALILNAIKKLAGLPDKIDLLSRSIIDSIAELKKNILTTKQISLNLEETLIALSISATTNPTAQFAMQKLVELRNCEIHITHIPTPGDEAGLRKMGVNLTSDPRFSSNLLWIN